MESWAGLGNETSNYSDENIFTVLVHTKLDSLGRVGWVHVSASFPGFPYLIAHLANIVTV